jgi:trimethylamine--corrinoid protein Co-methyltransferase
LVNRAKIKFEGAIMRKKNSSGTKSKSELKLEILDKNDYEKIHLATLEVLNKTGIFVDNKEALERLESSGCRIDKENQIVFYPEKLVENAIEETPSSFLAQGRDPDKDCLLDGSNVYNCNFGEGFVINDIESGERRPTTKQDLSDYTLMCDAMPNIDLYLRGALSHDVPQEIFALHNAEACLSNTGKHMFICPVDGYQANKIIEMVGAIVGGTDKIPEHRILSFVNCPTSPLRLTSELCENLMIGAEAGICNLIESEVMPGASGPVTLAGCIIIHNAELLASLVLSHVTKKGAPFIYGGGSITIDMRTAAACVGTPESSLLNGAIVQFARDYYNIPTLIGGG